MIILKGRSITLIGEYISDKAWEANVSIWGANVAKQGANVVIRGANLSCPYMKHPVFPCCHACLACLRCLTASAFTARFVVSHLQEFDQAAEVLQGLIQTACDYTIPKLKITAMSKS